MRQALVGVQRTDRNAAFGTCLPSGALHWEREFRYGKPAGTWRSWWENGQPRTECHYFGPDVEQNIALISEQPLFD